MTRVTEQLAFEDKLAAEARERTKQEEHRLARNRAQLVARRKKEHRAGVALTKHLRLKNSCAQALRECLELSRRLRGNP